MRCLYCHNPDTQEIFDNTVYSEEKLFSLVDSTKNYFGKTGGVTCSGGEPLLQAKNVNAFFKELKNRSIHTCLDTSGSILNDDVKELLNNTDLVLLDIKEFDDEKYKKLTGSSNKIVLEFAKYLDDNDIPFWVRYVLVPGYTDSEQDIESLSNFLKPFKSLERIEILPYHTFGVKKYESLNKDYALKDVEIPSKETLDTAKEIFKRNHENVFVR